MTVGVLAFVVALVVSIMLHEAGHLLTAKRFGMKATKYFLGFGPTLWSFRRGETEYGVKAIPAGGFVKIVGMTPLEDIEPGEEDRAFYKQPAPQRAVVLVAGSVTHFLLAYILLAITLIGVGVTTGNSTTTVARVYDCVGKERPEDCTPSDTPAPARQAGLKAGDRVVSLDGQPVRDWAEDFSKRIRARAAGPVTVGVERGGQRLDLTVNVARITREDPDRPGQTQEVGAIGVLPEAERKRTGVLTGLGRSFGAMGEGFTQTGKALVSIPGQIPDLLRSPEPGEVDAGRPISIVGAARISGQALDGGRLEAFLVLMAGLNIFVGIFNLLPLLPLDGGHLAILIFEQARSGVARLLGRSDPGRVDLQKLMPAAYVVIVLFVGLSVLLLYSDIANPIPNLFQNG